MVVNPIVVYTHYKCIPYERKGGMTIPKIKSWSTLAYIIHKDWLNYMGVSKNTGTPKMDGL